MKALNLFENEKEKHPIKCMPLGTNELMFHCASPPPLQFFNVTILRIF